MWNKYFLCFLKHLWTIIYKWQNILNSSLKQSGLWCLIASSGYHMLSLLIYFHFSSNVPSQQISYQRTWYMKSSIYSKDTWEGGIISKSLFKKKNYLPPLVSHRWMKNWPSLSLLSEFVMFYRTWLKCPSYKGNSIL